MKYFIALCFFLILPSLHNHIHAMEPAKKKIKAPSKKIDFTLIPFLQIFSDHILSEINGKIFDIICFKSSNLKEGARCINHFATACKSINILVNNKMLPIIKQLSDHYACSNEYAAGALQMSTATDILLKQLGFQNMCGDWDTPRKISSQNALHIKKSNIDLDFTYGKYCFTELMRASCGFGPKEKGKPYIVEWLINNGADITLISSQGHTAAFYATVTWNDGDKQLIEYFWDHPAFDANEIGTQGHSTGPNGESHSIDATLLMFFLLNSKHVWESIKEKNLRKQLVLLKLVKTLCEKGADPSLAPNKGKGDYIFFPTQTALSIAQDFGNHNLIKVLEDAIAKKKSQEQNSDLPLYKKRRLF